MEYFDPWRGTNQGAQTLATISGQIQQDQQQQRANKLADIQLQNAQMTNAEMARQQKVDAGARKVLADGANVPTTFADPATGADAKPMGLGVNQLTADPSLTELQPSKPVNSDRLLLDYYKKNDPAKASAMEKLMNDKFKALSEVDPKHAINWYNDVSGQNLTYAGKKGDYSVIHTADGTIVAVNTKDPKDMQVIQKGTPKTEHIPEGAAVSDGKGGWTVPAPKAEKPETKGFDTIDLGDKVKIIPRDGSAPYTEKKAAKPDTVIRVGDGTPKAPSGYRYKSDGTMEPIPGGPGDKTSSGRPLPASQAAELSDYSLMVKTLREAKALASKVNTGPVAGRIQSLGQLVGATDDNFSQFKQKLATVNNTMLKLRSGAAVTESEYQRFLQEMPTANDDERVRDLKLANATDFMQNMLDGKVATFRETGYKVGDGVSERASGITKPAAAKQAQAKKGKRPPPKF